MKKITTLDYINKLKEKNNKVVVVGEYINSFTKIKVRCNTCNYIWEANPSNLLRGHGCPKCGNSFKKDTNIFKNELMEINNTISVLGEYTGSRDNIKVKCNICNYIWDANPSNLLRGHGCPNCSGRVTITGVNDLYTTNPELTNYFVDIEDAKKYSANSHQRISFKCPDCSTKKEMRIADFFRRGFSCSVCDDGYSYPEKFVFSLLSQLGLKFTHQLTSVNFKWVGKFRYDFYLNDYNTIIEVNGDQHYNERKNFNKKNPRNEKQNDINKKLNALSNNVSRYIVIDASQSSFSWMKSHIEQSELSLFFNLSKIDWKLCEAEARKTRVYGVCEIKKNNPKLTSNEISKIVGIERSVVVDYLKIGKELNWCDYDAKEEQRLSAQRNRPRKRIAIKRLDGTLVGIFDSCSEVERQSINLFGFKMHFTEVAKRCNPKSDKYKKMYHEYIIEEIETKGI